MSSNPSVETSFSGTAPDLEIEISRTGRSVSLSAEHTTHVYEVHVATTAEWNAMTTYIPRSGEICIYSDRTEISDVTYVGVKIGDGTTYVPDLPFVGDDQKAIILAALSEHTGNSDIHVTTTDKTFWNNKLNCAMDSVDGEMLVFNRN